MNYFSHGRTALKYGIKYLNLKKNDIILLPNYICDVVLIPLLQLKIKPLFYEINDNMQPNWDQLNTIISRKVKAIMIVHYFGFPQDLNKIKKYCLKNNLLLIEDNAHGHGGEYKGQLLGTFGDIGFSSPRKLYPIDYGGILYTKNDQKIKKLPYPNLLNRIKKIIKRRTGNLFSNNKFYDYDKSDLESIEIMQNSIKDMSIDNRSLHKLNNIDFGEIRKYRAIIYNLWEKYTLDNGLHPVYNKLINNIIPWNYSAYASDLDERNKWLDWGFKNNISVYTWPRLPISFIDEKNNVLDRWNRLICFPIVQKMSLKKLKNIFR